MDVVAGRGGYRWILVLIALIIGARMAHAEVPPSNVLGEPEWIWSAAVPKDRAPLGTCYFRKTFDATNAESARVQISGDDRYELFVNGRAVGSGSDWHVMQSFDITKYLTRGPNVIAVKAENTQGGSAGLVARVTVKARGTTEVSHSTDNTWLTRSTETPGWQRAGLNESTWVAARTLGEFGVTAPWGDQVQTNDGSQAKRFSVTRDFRVERVVAPQSTGSAIAMAFNEWGEILLSREGGSLLLVIDKDKDNVPDTAVEYCTLVKNVQGILPLNGDVFVVADGPQGAGLYCLKDDDQDGQAENAKMLFGFEGGVSEHGAHALALGPEGMIYVMIGNHSSVKRVEGDDTAKDGEAGGKNVFSSRSPYQHWYEGDLLEPKYEDANGHAVGIKAPCGTVVRTDAEGRVVQLVAGGLRNAYDMVFNKDGELFTYDSDMEWDMGLPWYRPTRIYHVVPGAEFGSRSGWSPWPEYYLDGLPPSLETGRGSPTGIEVYTHHAYPSTYYNAMFACDWSQGRILVVRTKSMGGSYEVDGGVFLEGRPLNVTDIAVGPDGCVYFCTGGRATEGGVYRIVYTGKAPQQPKYTPLQQAIRQPQMNAAWARQKVALIQQKYTKEWNSQLPAVALETKNVVDDRLRAMDLMHLYGPAADAKMITRLAKDPQPPIRAKTAFMIGTHSDASYVPLIEQLLADKDPLVRRMACEAIVRGGYKVDAQAILPLLADSYRFVGWAARRAIQTVPQGQWRAEVVESKNIRLFLDGSTALLAMDADVPTCESVVEQVRVFLRGYVSDDDFIDLMRVVSLALKRGDLKGNDLPQLRTELAREYPCSDVRMNRELIRVLAYLDEPSVIPALLRELRGKAPEVEKLHAALCARFITRGWTTDQRLALLEFYEAAGHQDGGHSFAGYIENISKDFFAQFDDDQRRRVLAEGERWPTAALSVLATIEKPSPAIVSQLIQLDQQLAGFDNDASRKLQTGIIAVLSSSESSEAFKYLRRAYERWPERRDDLAMGLAQAPNGENWPILLRSLSVVDGVAAEEVLVQLSKANQKTTDPEPVRQVILCGLRLKDSGGQHAIALLNKWVGTNVNEANDSWDAALEKWQDWYARTYPDAIPAALPVESETSKWTYQELTAFLNSDEAGHGQASRGAVIFDKAQCVRCHRFGGRGEGIGPDLSTVGQRFQKKEILQSIVHPSQVISDQYSSKTITTVKGRSYTGIVGSGGPGVVIVLQSNGEKVAIAKDQIDEIAASPKSAMPDGLLDTLTLDEIADLFAYLTAQPSRVTQRPR